ncbi:YceI family protein [Dermatobacter hominis]|uniref:YceI family protein n=1 Tax=Dermatobacter hominis TaxID=2884263 RepID=UPI001D120677|nr:YceI family protein [Dermatobacter hominis]UDY35334.1 YceI family protein [Dermatobacter hominis]
MTTKAKSISAVVVIAVLALVGGGLYWFLRDDSPDEVDLDAAAKGVTTTTVADGATTTAGAAADTGIDGAWTVDTTSGEWTYESATGTFVGFRIKEELASIGSTEAVGRTDAVTGTMTIARDQVTDAELTIDLTKITTNESRRDNRVQSALQTDQFPQATFTLTAPIDLGPDAANGAEVTATAKGELTIHGVTEPVEFPLQAKLVDGTVVVVGSLDVTFSDYGVQVPSAPIVLSVEDHGVLELQLLFTKG